MSIPVLGGCRLPTCRRDSSTVAGNSSTGGRGNAFGQRSLYESQLDASTASVSIRNDRFVAFVLVFVLKGLPAHRAITR